MKLGYARISTGDQTLDLQRDALAAAGCARISEETASGASPDRPVLQDAIAYARAGDVLIVWRLDRLGRSLPHLLATVRAFEERGIGLPVSPNRSIRPRRAASSCSISSGRWRSLSAI